MISDKIEKQRMTEILIQNLTKRFGGVAALNDISLEFPSRLVYLTARSLRLR